MWKANKKRELGMRRQVQILYRDLVLMSKLDDGREKVGLFCTFLFMCFSLPSEVTAHYR